MNPRTPDPKRRIPRNAWPCVAAAAFVVAMVAWRFDPDTGFTSLLRFGAPFEESRLPALEGLPIHTFETPGYDGQFYAQLAVDPHTSKPEVQTALDSSHYRARRILLPAVVHVLGAGNAWITLNLFALSNLAVWLALGWMLWHRVRSDGSRGTVIWLACMLSLGALDSVRMSLTDLPAMFLIFLAIEFTSGGKRIPALAALGAAALTRETAVLAAGVAEGGDLGSEHTWVRHMANALIVVAPLAIWVAWLSFTLGTEDPTSGGNTALPFVAAWQHALRCMQEIASGSLSSRHVFGLIAVPCLLFQAWWVVWRTAADGFASSPWVRVGLPFALLLTVLGEAVWTGYWAAARACLPLTFAFNLLLPRDGRFWWWLAIGNAFALHGIYRMLPG